MALSVARRTKCQGGALSSFEKSASHRSEAFGSAIPRSDFLTGSKLTPASGALRPSSKPNHLAGRVLVNAYVPKETYYTVQKGDSLYRIAKEHDVKLSSLANANAIRIARRVPIVPGQRLKIPGVKDRAVLNKQEKQRMAEKLKRLAAGNNLSTSKEQLRASLVPRVPSERKPAEVNRSSNLVASVAVDSRPTPPPRSPAFGVPSLWQPAGILLLLGAAFFYFTRPKPAAQKVDPMVRKARAIESSKLNLRPADPPKPLPVFPPRRTVVAKEAPSEGASTEPGTLRYSRVGNSLFAVGSPRVLETMLSSSAQEIDVRPIVPPPQYASEKAGARKVLEERLAAARAQVTETQRRAELARERAAQAAEAKEAVWGTVERIRELSSINEEVLRVAEEALAEVSFQKELALARIERR